MAPPPNLDVPLVIRNMTIMIGMIFGFSSLLAAICTCSFKIMNRTARGEDKVAAREAREPLTGGGGGGGGGGGILPGANRCANFAADQEMGTIPETAREMGTPGGGMPPERISAGLKQTGQGSSSMISKNLCVSLPQL